MSYNEIQDTSLETNNGNDSLDAFLNTKAPDFSVKGHDDYWKSDYQSIIDNTSNGNYDALAKQLQSDVSYLSNEFSSVQDQMTEWAGVAGDTAKEAIQTVMGKLECTMDNINCVVGPACSKIEEFKEQLERLKAGKEELNGADGNGGLDKELKNLEDAYKTAYYKHQGLSSNPEPTHIWVDSGYNGKKKKIANPNYKTWKASLDAAKSEMDEAQNKVLEKRDEIKAKEAELNELLEDVSKSYSLIMELVNSVKSFKEYFGNGSKAGLFGDVDEFTKNINQIIENLDKISLDSVIDYTNTSQTVLADRSFFENACKGKDGWHIDGDVVYMIVDGKECKYDMTRHMFSNGDTFINEYGNPQEVELESYFYLPKDMSKSGDFSQLRNLNTYTFFSSDQEQYRHTVEDRETNSINMMVIKQDPFNERYGTLTSLTKACNEAVNTNLKKCHNSIGGDSIYGAHSLKIAANSGDLYDTVYCVDNAAIVDNLNGKAGTKEQFKDLEELSGLNGKNIFFINTSGDDNYSYGVKKKKDKDGNEYIYDAYALVGTKDYVSEEEVKNSFTYTGIELVAETCPDAKIHILYQAEDAERGYQTENFPKALDELASRFDNVSNDSKMWKLFASEYYHTHSEGNFIPHDLVAALSTIVPNYQDIYSMVA